MKIIRQARTVMESGYQVEYRYKADPNHGFVFDCDESGVVSITNNVMLENYINCQSDEFTYSGVIRKEKRKYVPAIGVCPICGSKIALDGVVRCRVCNSYFYPSGVEVELF